MDFADRFVTVANPLAAFKEVYSDLAVSRAVAAIATVMGNGPGRAPTRVPVRGWSLDALLTHLDEFLDEVAAAVGAEGPDHQPGSSRVYAAFHRRGYVHERGPTPLGVQPGAVMIQYVINELVAHSWDLSTGSNCRNRLPDWLAERSMLSWKVFFETFGRPAEHFDPEREAPPNTTAATVLAAFLGREIPDSPLVLWRDPKLLAADRRRLRAAVTLPAPRRRPRLPSRDAMEVLFSERPKDWDPAWL